MAKLALYRKYRPTNFDEVFGQDHISVTLKNAVSGQNFSHAYLFYGPRGTGKTSMARIFAKAINCLDLKDGNPCNKCENCLQINEGRAIDIIEIDAASHTQVDNIREVIVDRANFAPTKLKYKVYIIDEAHMLSKSSFNALLKTLEEPPEHAIFILATTESHKIIPTIKSRCQKFDFRRINAEVVKNRLIDIAKSEKIPVDEEALMEIARNTDGGFRDAISLLDQISSKEGKVTKASLDKLDGSENLDLLFSLIESVLEKNVIKSLEKVKESIVLGYEGSVLIKNILEILRNLMLVKAAGVDLLNLMEADKVKYEALAGKCEINDVTRLLDLIIRASEQKFFVLPQLPLEIAIVKYTSNAAEFIETSASAKSTSKAAAPKQKVTDIAKVSSADNNGKWQEFLLEVKSINSSVHAFLKVCDPLFDEEEVVLGFPYKFHKEMIEDIKNRRIVEESLTKVYGKNYRVKCKLHVNTTRQTAAKSAPVMDDLLDEALEIFGGEVTE
jgi:DNA polymerase-3 subunit gamma/tau